MKALLKTAVIYLTTAMLVTGCASAILSQGVESRIESEEVDIKCVVSAPRMKQTWIIRTEAEYQELLQYKLSLPECTRYVDPSIDFRKKTLLVFLVSASGCKNPEFRKEILYNRSSNRYTFLVNTIQYGACRKMYVQTVLVTIPKIKKYAQVDFKVVEKVVP